MVDEVYDLPYTGDQTAEYLAKARDFSGEVLGNGLYTSGKTYTNYQQYLNDNGALFKLNPSIDVPYEVNLTTYGLAKDDPNLIPYTSFESASTEAIDDFNESAQEVLDEINESLSDANGELFTLSQAASDSAIQAAASAADASRIAGIDDISGAIATINTNVAFEVEFNDSLKINKGFGKFDILDVSSEQDGSTLVNLNSKSVTYTRSSNGSVHNKSGILDSLSANSPAIGADGIWIHGDYQNELLHSEDYTNAVWAKVGTCTVSSTTETDPKGGNNASLISNCDSFANRITQSISASIDAQDSMSGSVWIKGEGSVLLTFQSGVVGQVFALTGEWQEIHFIQASDAGIGELRINGENNTSSFYIFAAQITKSQSKLPYIKSESSKGQATEVEATAYTVGNFPEYGTPFAIEIDCAIPILGRDTRAYSQLNSFYLRRSGGGTVNAAASLYDGTVIVTNAATVDDSPHKFVVRVGYSQMDLFIDGELSKSSSIYDTMPVVDFNSKLTIGDYGGGVNFHLNSQIKNLRIHHGVVSDDTVKSWGGAL